MASNKTPDDATGDSVNVRLAFLARCESFLRSLLVFLGFGAMPEADMYAALDTLTQWLDGASKIRRDPLGATARVWWDAFKMAWKDDAAQIAGVRADNAAAEFGKRFLPVADDERDTLNTADFEAMREELELADNYRSDICDALAGNDTEFKFEHARVIIELRAERDALLKANRHHASEIEQLRESNRQQRDRISELRTNRDTTLNGIDSAICDAFGWQRDAVFNRIDALAELQKERDELKREAESVRDNIDSICTQHALAGTDYTNKTFAIAGKLDELKRALDGAIVPQPKPECVVTGQLWAYVDHVVYVQQFDEDAPLVSIDNKRISSDKMLMDPNWHYIRSERV